MFPTYCDEVGRGHTGGWSNDQCEEDQIPHHQDQWMGLKRENVIGKTIFFNCQADNWLTRPWLLTKKPYHF